MIAADERARACIAVAPLERRQLPDALRTLCRSGLPRFAEDTCSGMRPYVRDAAAEVGLANQNR